MEYKKLRIKYNGVNLILAANVNTTNVVFLELYISFQFLQFAYSFRESFVMCFLFSGNHFGDSA